MSSPNSFGRLFKITSFGESHGPALGVVIEGCPAGVKFSQEILNDLINRRRPGQNATVTARQESDTPEILSGVYEGQTLGTPIAVMVRNQDARSQDYDDIAKKLKDVAAPAPRAGHADDVWREKFGHTDPRGGGRSSGRETLARVIGGAFAKMLVQTLHSETEVIAFPRAIGTLDIADADLQFGAALNITEEKKSEIDKMLLGLKAEGDSVGGLGEIQILKPTKSLGQPVFNKLKSDLAAAFMSVGATTGVELGGGFNLAAQRGTEVHGGGVSNSSAKNYGGIRGGVSTGETISLKVAFKPTSSILDVAKKGRHDPCIVIRALPVLEAMTWLVLADHVLARRLDRIEST